MVVGSKLPAMVTINEMITVAAVWTHNQFIDDTVIKDPPLQLEIAPATVSLYRSTNGWLRWHNSK